MELELRLLEALEIYPPAKLRGVLISSLYFLFSCLNFAFCHVSVNFDSFVDDCSLICSGDYKLLVKWLKFILVK